MDPDIVDVEADQSILQTTEIDEAPPSSNIIPITFDGVTDEEISPLGGRKLHRDSQNGDVAISSGSDESSAETTNEDDRPPPKPSILIPSSKFRALPYATARTGVVYDVRMRYHIDQVLPVDDAHPEKPSRISEIYKELLGAGLMEDPADPDSASDFQMVRIPSRMATPAEICLVHSLEHLEMIKSTAVLSLAEIMARSVSDDNDSIYWHNQTWLCASLSAGGAIEATRAVLAGQVRNAVAVIRPPGHHAECDKPSGFCFFNNVPIAARVAQQEYPCRKILILDWDVHHGNGTQQAFYNDPNVLYVSIHVHQNGAFYPRGDYGDHVHCGEGPGLGRNVNVPWLEEGMTDADYMLAFQQVVMPICIEFDPDLVMISAGFDAAAGDPLGQCFVSPAGFAHMTHMLMQLAKGRVVACLEGGYNLGATSRSFVAMTRTIMGEPPERMGDMTPTPSAVTTLQRVIRQQSRFWKCLYPKDLQLDRKRELGSERLHDVLRKWQSKVLFDNFRMVSLFILRQQISRSYKNQVMATPNYHERRPLLVIFHDPPEALGYPDPRTSQLELHNTWITDVSKSYVKWANDNGFAVIDVNIPRHITQPDDYDKGYEDVDSEAERLRSTREAAFYLWDNYLEISDSTHIFLMGIGDAYGAIAILLRDHSSCLHSIDLAIGFIAQNNLVSVSDPDEPSVAQMYYNHSMIFMSPDHAAFDPILGKKPKKRHGAIVKSTRKNLQEMLKEHLNDVAVRLLEETRDWRETRDEVTETTDEDVMMDADDEEQEVDDPATNLKDVSLLNVPGASNGVATRAKPPDVFVSDNDYSRARGYRDMVSEDETIGPVAKKKPVINTDPSRLGKKISSPLASPTSRLISSAAEKLSR